MLVGNFRGSWQCLHLQYEDFCSFSGAPPPFLTPPLDSATHKTVHNKIERKIHTHTRRNRKTPSKSYVQRRQVTLLQVRDVNYCQGGCRLVDQGCSQGGKGADGWLKLVRINKRLLAHGVQWQPSFYAQLQDTKSAVQRILTKYIEKIGKYFKVFQNVWNFLLSDFIYCLLVPSNPSQI